MPDPFARIRTLLLNASPSEERERVEELLEDQENRLRLARIDAGLPVRARQRQVYPHPHRRATDRA
jgi:hypothetical protein